MSRLALAADFLISTFVLATGLYVIYRAAGRPDPNTILAIGLVVTGIGMFYVFAVVIKLSLWLSGLKKPSGR